MASGEGLSAALTEEEETISIVSRDRWGNTEHTGGLVFEISIKDNVSGNKFDATQEDLHNGTYLVHYKLVKSGAYVMDIYLNGEQVHGSPFFIECKWGKTF